jgi:hypothetical protein
MHKIATPDLAGIQITSREHRDRNHPRPEHHAYCRRSSEGIVSLPTEHPMDAAVSTSER